jgi:beta-N-acetylhexosaminidase
VWVRPREPRWQAWGINLNLAPVVDVNVNPTNPSIGALDRSFSADPT